VTDMAVPGRTVSVRQEAPKYRHSVRVRKARSDDAEDILRVALSVGNQWKNPHLGFLLADYSINPDVHRRLISQKIRELDHFYVAESRRVCGFLMAYHRDHWLSLNPGWLAETHWKPGFDLKKTRDFILIDKTAVMAGMTGQGIGSSLYAALFRDIAMEGVEDIFAETVVAPHPNFASLEFRRKQRYELAGVRFETIDGVVHTTLVYHRKV